MRYAIPAALLIFVVVGCPSAWGQTLAADAGFNQPILPSLDAEFNTLRRLLPKDGDLIHPPFPEQLGHYGKIRARVFEDEAVPGGKALRVRVKRPGNNAWDAGISGAVAGAIAAGDALVMVFYVRAAKGPGTIAAAGLQLNSEPYTAIVSEPVAVSTELRRVVLSGTATQDFDAGQAGYFFQVAGQKQTLEFGPVFIFNLGQGVPPDELP